MKLLITGICGFVGSTLAKAWLAAEPGLTIYGMDNLSRPGSECNRMELQRLGIALMHGDLRLSSDLEGLPSVDWVLDAAANPSVLAGIDGSSRQLVENNLSATINLLEYCKNHHAGLLLISTSRVYSLAAFAAIAVEVRGGGFRLNPDQPFPVGLSEAGIAEGFSTTPPLSLYGSSKLAAEILALEYGAAFNFPVWINRCGLLAGAGQFGRSDQGIVAYWIHSWQQHRPLAYLGFGGKGHQMRDVLHPLDLLTLLRCQTASGSMTGSSIFNLGGGPDRTFSLAELSRWCEKRFGHNDVAGDPANRPYDLPWIVMDSTLAQHTWSWQPQISREAIFEEIACHAEKHPDWLARSGLR